MDNRTLTMNKLCKRTSKRLLDSIYLLEILYEMTDGDAKEGTLVNTILNKIKPSFKDVSNCRTLIENIK